MTIMFLGRDVSVIKHPLSLNDPLVCRLQGNRGEPGPLGPAGLKGDGFLGPTVRKGFRHLKCKYYITNDVP